MKRIWSQCRKDLIQFRRDRLTVALALLLPLMTLLIYGFAVRLEAKNIPLVVQDFDNSPLSRSYIEQIYATNQFRATRWPGGDPAIHALDHGFAKAVITIPPEFSRQIKAGKPSSVQILIDGTDTNNARVIQNSIHATTDAFLQSARLTAISAPIPLDLRVWFNPGRKESLFIVPGAYGMILLVFPALLISISIEQEREKGNLVQVYASGIQTIEFLLGKGLAFLLIGLGQALFTMIIGAVVFGTKFVGDPTPLLVGTPLYISVSILFGLLMGFLNSDVIMTVEAIAVIGFEGALLMSGFIYSVSNIPYPLRYYAQIFPATYYIQLTRDAFVRGSGWSGIWFAVLMLAVLGLILFAIAYRLLRKMQLPG